MIFYLLWGGSDLSVIGHVVEGSYKDGIKVSLSPLEDIEEFPIGSLAIISTDNNIYLTILNDIRFHASISSSLISHIPKKFRERIISYLRDNKVDNFAYFTPIAKSNIPDGIPEKPDTVPPYGSNLIKATVDNLSLFYGESDWSVNFPLGSPKVVGDIKYEVPINIEDLVNLNMGIYGKSGSGKTFVANLIVGYGLLYRLKNIEKENFVDLRFLIFDMHDEYSLHVLDNSRRPVAKGIANIFRNEFEIFTPDLENSKKYNMSFLPIPLYNIHTQLLKIIIRPLGVSISFLDNLKSFERKIKSIFRGYGDKVPIFKDSGYWVLGLLLSYDTVDKIYSLISKEDNPLMEFDPSISRDILVDMIDNIEASIIKEGRGVYESFKAGRRRLIRFLDMPISLKKKFTQLLDEVVDLLIMKSGKSVVISMGRFEKTMPVYLALANFIGEKLREKLLEDIYGGGFELSSKIIILLEEAHKFLSKEAEEYSPFGVIAREMRKRGVIVVPIDQKPGDLDPDVTGMIWTNIVFALTNSRDVNAAISGLENPKLYESIVNSLKPGEALIYGPAVKFPVVLKISDYSKMSLELERDYRKLIMYTGFKDLRADDITM